jgi:hypothetical protein
MKKQGVVIVQDETKPVPREILAQAIAEIGSSFRHLRMSGLNRRAIIVLVAHSAKLGHGTIEAVLDALENLRRDYCN